MAYHGWFPPMVHTFLLPTPRPTEVDRLDHGRAMVRFEHSAGKSRSAARASEKLHDVLRGIFGAQHERPSARRIAHLIRFLLCIPIALL